MVNFRESTKDFTEEVSSVRCFAERVLSTPAALPQPEDLKMLTNGQVPREI